MKKKQVLLPILTTLAALALLLAEHFSPEAWKSGNFVGCIQYSGYPNWISVLLVFLTLEALIASVCALIFRRMYPLPALFGGAAVITLLYAFATGQGEHPISVLTAVVLAVFLTLAMLTAIFAEEKKAIISQDKTAVWLRYLALLSCAFLLLAELLPNSVVDMMSNGPGNPGIPMYGSYFYYIGFGYANFPPLLAGIFTVHALVFGAWAALAKRGSGLQAVFGGLVLLMQILELSVFGGKSVFGTWAAALATSLGAAHFALALAAAIRQRKAG